MKQSILRKLMLITVLLTVSHAFAHDFEVDGIYYNITSATDFTVEVTYQGISCYEYDGEYTGDIIIPKTITYEDRTYSVISIDDNAFFECMSLISVTIPNSVISIGDSAFYGCIDLISVTIPNSVTSIGG